MTPSDAGHVQEVAVLVRIAQHSSPITGSVQSSGTPERFVGWLQLSALLEQIRAERTATDSEGGAQ